MDIFTYSDDDYEFHVPCSNTFSKFDLKLKSSWEQKMNDGVFRYRLNITKQKSFGEKFYLQLNVDRAAHRRRPSDIRSMNQPFNPSIFNFTQIKEIEKMFFISPKTSEEPSKHIIATNVSPLEYGHILLIPSCETRLPQVLTKEALQIAVEMILLSKTSYFRVGFNSLGGFATVNHLHLHGYYLQRCMYLEKAPVEVIVHPCYRILNFPSKGFVFQIESKEEIDFIVINVFKLVTFLQTSNISYNLYITRGVSFNNKEIDSNLRNSLRIYIWPRKSEFGVKDLSNLNAATCELFGHLVIKNEHDFDILTENQISNILENLTVEPFKEVMKSISEIFSS